MRINISSDFHSFLPNARLGIISGNVQAKTSFPELDGYLESVCIRHQALLESTTPSSLDVIKETREAYKILGKEPSRYRPSAEALLRRIKQGKGIYRINNLVDTINLISIETQFSIGAYDLSCVKGDITMERASGNIPYEAIGRGQLNIEYLPALKDDNGFFGSPTSDSVRTSLKDTTHEMLVVIYDFQRSDTLTSAMKTAKNLLHEFAFLNKEKVEILESEKVFF